jgi:hypothetical protein
MAAKATWKELCMDTAESSTRLGQFWAAVLGGEHHSTATDPAGDVVVPGLEGADIAVCKVPEAKTVKHRVHIDVFTGSVADLEALGASVLLPAEQSGFRWTVMADPEGGEFCAFVREPAELPAYRFYALNVDAADPERIAHWWGDVFGTAVQRGEGDGGWHWIESPSEMPFEGIVFGPVSEPKTVKNRIHWDVYGDTAELLAAGATLLRRKDTEIRWDVLADPEGNEFCVFTR